MKNRIIGVNKKATEKLSLKEFLNLHQPLTEYPNKEKDLTEAFYKAFPEKKKKPKKVKTDDVSE